VPFGTRSRPHPCPDSDRPRRPIALLLLLGVLLLSALACSVSVDGHARTAGSPALAAERHAPMAADRESHVPHPGSHCVPGTDGRSPQGRSAAAAAAPSDLGGAAPAAAVRPAVRDACPRRRPAPTGRSTLADLCRCRR
jgi:hypothetical protein